MPTRQKIIAAIILLVFVLILIAGVHSTENEEKGLEYICLKHKVRDNIKPDCIKIIGKNDSFPEYKCFSYESKNFETVDDIKEWEILFDDDSRCKKRKNKKKIVPRETRSTPF